MSFVLPPRQRVIVIGDIHGDLGQLIKCLYASRLINQALEWIAEPSDTALVQLGDQIDNLPRTDSDTRYASESYADIEVIHFMDRIRASAEKKGGLVISLIGNHEIMNVEGNFSYVTPSSISKMGGEAARREAFRPGGIYAKILARRPVVAQIGSLLFCHGALLPYHMDGVTIDDINQLACKYLQGAPLSDLEHARIQKLLFGPDSILWSRVYQEGNPVLVFSNICQLFRQLRANHVFVGHSPVPFIRPCFENRVWMMDVGLSKAFGGRDIQILEILNDGRSFQIIRTEPKK